MGCPAWNFELAAILRLSEHLLINGGARIVDLRGVEAILAWCCPDFQDPESRIQKPIFMFSDESLDRYGDYAYISYMTSHAIQTLHNTFFTL